MVNKALAERLDTSLGALVPINQATGPVDEHQDTFKDGTPVGIASLRRATSSNGSRFRRVHRGAPLGA